MVHRGSRVIVVCGPSGSGKSSLLRRLFDEFPDKFGFSVSHTTRKPRPGEEDGKHYHFTTKEAMEEAIKKGEFLESAIFSNNIYGTSKAAVEAVRQSGKVCVLDIEVQGVEQVKKTDLNPLYIFVKPPSLNALESRLKGRGTETEESLERRLNTAKEELKYGETPGNFDFVLVNDNLEKSYEQLRMFIMSELENKELSEFLILPGEIPRSSGQGYRDIYGGEVMCWDVNSTKLLIDLFKKYKEKEGTLKIKTMKQMWRVISDELSEITKQKFTEYNCENRWRVLDRNYKKYIDSKNSMGSGRKVFKYAEEMDDLFGYKRNVHPELVLSLDTIVQEKPQEKTEIATTGQKMTHKIMTDTKRRTSILEQIRQDRLEYQKKRLEQEERKIALLERKVLLLEKQATESFVSQFPLALE